MTRLATGAFDLQAKQAATRRTALIEHSRAQDGRFASARHEFVRLLSNENDPCSKRMLLVQNQAKAELNTARENLKSITGQ
jgi:hypothetical protein